MCETPTLGKSLTIIAAARLRVHARGLQAQDLSKTISHRPPLSQTYAVGVAELVVVQASFRPIIGTTDVVLLLLFAIDDGFVAPLCSFDFDLLADFDLSFLALRR